MTKKANTRLPAHAETLAAAIGAATARERNVRPRGFPQLPGERWSFGCCRILPGFAAAFGLALVCLGQSGDDVVVVSPEFVVEGQIVKGVPYTAETVTTLRQVLATGSEISSQMKALEARDSDGRTRREQTIRAIGPWAVLPGREPNSAGRSAEGPTVILIQDPVKLVTYTLDPRTRIARISQSLAPLDPAALRERLRQMSQRETEAGNVEALGTQTIEGVVCRGKRTVTTIPARRIGNTAPLELIVESWYSPDLHLVILGKRTDPRVGEIVYRRTNLKRGEPAASLFEVPQDYHVERNPERREERREQ